MIKEEVKAQLDKCPLEWKKGCSRFGKEYLVAPLRIGELSLEMRIHYEPKVWLKHAVLWLIALAHRDEAGGSSEAIG